MVALSWVGSDPCGFAVLSTVMLLLCEGGTVAWDMVAVRASATSADGSRPSGSVDGVILREPPWPGPGQTPMLRATTRSRMPNQLSSSALRWPAPRPAARATDSAPCRPRCPACAGARTAGRRGPQLASAHLDPRVVGGWFAQHVRAGRVGRRHPKDHLGVESLGSHPGWDLNKQARAGFGRRVAGRRRGHGLYDPWRVVGPPAGVVFR
jgi:hypothetical protein